MRHRTKFREDRLNRSGYMADFRFFKMAAVSHLRFALRVFGPPTKSICWSLSLCKIWLESVCGFDNMPVLMFCEFGSKMPIDAPFWVVFGGFDPLDETQYQPILQKFYLLIISVPAVYYLCWCL